MSLYYYKDLQAKYNPPEINFDHIWRTLDFRELETFPKNKQALDKWLNEYPPGAPNLAAAVFTQIHYRKPLKELLESAFEYCTHLISERGYQPTQIRELVQMAYDDTNNVILVAGCQGHKIRQSRSRAAYQLVNNISHVHFEIVFSGKNPANAGTGLKVRTPDEALDMQADFLRLVDKNATLRKQHNVTVHLENKSANSDQNISNFLSGDYFRKDKPIRLFLTSSTFHIPRLAELVEKHLTTDSTLKGIVKKIIMIASEEFKNNYELIKTTPYVKWMMYTVFEHLLKHSPRHSIGS